MGHQLEREFSAQSLSSSGGDSETGSRYVFESGFYITSFVATFFIGGLVTTGVLLITLLIALTVMLQSCQSKSSGLVELNHHHYNNYCQMFTQHAEINNLKPRGFPLICLDSAFRAQQYTGDLIASMSLIENYFDSTARFDDGLDIVLLDIDDIPQFTYLLTTPSLIEDANYLKHVHTLELYKRLQSSGWHLILFSRKAERQRNSTTEHLISLGYNNWTSLIMRSEDEMQLESEEYFSKRIEKEGFHINSVISSRMDAIITGRCIGKRVFKLPNPVYYIFEDRIEGKYT